MFRSTIIGKNIENIHHVYVGRRKYFSSSYIYLKST